MTRDIIRSPDAINSRQMCVFCELSGDSVMSIDYYEHTDIASFKRVINFILLYNDCRRTFLLATHNTLFMYTYYNLLDVNKKTVVTLFVFCRFNFYDNLYDNNISYRYYVMCILQAYMYGMMKKYYIKPPTI